MLILSAMERALKIAPKEPNFLDTVHRLQDYVGPSFNVLVARASDEERIAEFQASHRVASEHTAKDIARSFDGERGVLIVLEREGEIFGLCGVQSVDGNGAELKALVLSPAYRGQGLGQTVLRSFMRSVLCMGFGFVQVRALPGMTATQTFFRSQGFRLTSNGRTEFLKYEFGGQDWR